MARTRLALDTFTTATKQLVTAYSANYVWIDGTSNAYMKVDDVLDAVQMDFGDGSGRHVVMRSGTFSPDQYSEVKIGGLGSSTGDWFGPGVLCNGLTEASCAYYVLEIRDLSAQTRLVRVNAGADTVLAGYPITSITWANNDLAGLEVTIVGGNPVLQIYQNGSPVGSPFTDTSGSKLVTGNPVITFNVGSGDIFTIDDWDYGDLTTAAPDLTGSATLDGITASGGMATLAPSTLTGSATLDGVTAGGALGVAGGTFTSEPLTRNTAVFPGATTLSWLAFRDASTGAPVGTVLTGVAVSAGGIFTVAPAFLVPGTTYLAEWLEAGGQRGYGVKAAA